MLFEDQLAALGGRLQKSARRAGDRLRAAGRRPRRRARAGHHHRRRLPLLRPTSASSSSPTPPGHEQYTRNMVTGASTADLAVILIDARKGMLTQTRRHSYLVELLGIRHVVLASTRWTWWATPRACSSTPIVADYRAFAASSASGACRLRSRPRGRQRHPSARADAPWYHGPTLMGTSRRCRGR